MTKKTYYTYNDIFLVPQYTELESRKAADTSTIFGGMKLDIPFISANMDTITGPEMAKALWNIGAIGALHRFNDTEGAIKDYVNVRHNDGKDIAGECIVSIGVNKDFKQRAIALYGVGARLFVVDVAHGHSAQVKNTLCWLRKEFADDITIIAGNVAAPVAVHDLASWGADVVKVGVGPGSVCKTRVVTGHGVPQFSCLLECAIAADLVGCKLIADGGIRNSGDIVKSFVAGADYVMLGSLLSGTQETPGDVIIKDNGEKIKQFRGMASNDAQVDYKGKGKYLPAEEGISSTVKYKGAAIDIILELKKGLQSGMSYCNAAQLNKIYHNAVWALQTTSGLNEGTPHLK